MNDRPYEATLIQKLNKPLVQVGDIPTTSKNNLRNYILNKAKQEGYDAVKFQNIKDNKASHQDVTFIFDPISSAFLQVVK